MDTTPRKDTTHDCTDRHGQPVEAAQAATVAREALTEVLRRKNSPSADLDDKLAMLHVVECAAHLRALATSVEQTGLIWARNAGASWSALGVASGQAGPAVRGRYLRLPAVKARRIGL